MQIPKGRSHLLEVSYPHPERSGSYCSAISHCCTRPSEQGPGIPIAPERILCPTPECHPISGSYSVFFLLYQASSSGNRSMWKAIDCFRGQCHSDSVLGEVNHLHFEVGSLSPIEGVISPSYPEKVRVE